MTHLALYREWRPKIFDEVVEQKHAVYALRQSVISGQIAHAYLFSGTRGTGKTTLAKIFARAINCLDPHDGNPCNQCAICRGMFDGSLMDIVEMDAASNNSVDNIRRICDEVVFMPAQARYKVYIIDEVHMLSTGAFNALLKTLEEPPAHAVFILATTEPHRIPATILSRCQRYEFRRIPVGSIAGRLAEIAAADSIDVTPDALQTIAALADGAMRDAISLLDQARASFAGTIGRDDVLSLAGVVQDEFMQQMAQALIRSEAPTLLVLVDQLVMAGRDLARFVTDLAQHFRNILICQVSANPQQLVRATSDSLAAMQDLAGQVSSEQLVDLIKGLSALLSDLRWAADARTALEIGLIRLMGPSLRSQPAQPVQRINAVPAAAISPAPAPTPAPAAKTAVSGPIAAVKPSPAAKPAPLLKPISSSAPSPDLQPDAVPPPDEVPLPEPPPAENEGQNDDLDPEPQLPPEPVPEPAAELAPAAALALDVGALWQKMLDYIANEGHMTLYLFSRAARPRLSGNILQLLFAAGEQVNYHEASSANAIKLLRSAAARLAGHELDVQPLLAGSQPDREPLAPDASETGEDDWIRKIKTTADTLGIPVKMEE